MERIWSRIQRPANMLEVWAGWLGAALACVVMAVPAGAAAETKVVEVVAAKTSSCALMEDGTVRCWGTGNSGELGNGEKSNEPLPAVQVEGISDAKHIFLGGSKYSIAICAQNAEGKVKCWGGGNAIAQEGRDNALTPVDVPALDGVKDVAGSLNGFACAVMGDGTVKCWGGGAFGVLGNGAKDDQKMPVQAAGVTNAVDAACGQNHCCAAQADGTVMCWGYNSSGQVNPSGGRDPIMTPVAVEGVTTAKAVGAGGSTSCAILEDGSTVCWGSGFYQGPKPLEGVGSVKTMVGSNSVLCAINTEGKLFCWGNNYFGQLGAGLEEKKTYSKPEAVTALANVVSVSAGESHTCAATADGEGLCWGKNDKGQLGYKTEGETANVPAAVASVRASVEQLQKAVAKAEQVLQDEREALTPEKYEELFLAMAACEVKGWQIDSKCEEKKAFDQAKSRNTSLKDMAGLYADLGRKHIAHESPAVRLQAAGLMGSVFGASADSQKVLLDAANQESHPGVLRGILRSVGSSLGKNDGVFDLVLNSADHEDEDVRIEATSSLTAWGKSREGALEKVLQLIENDSSDKVKQYACESIGRMEDERALPLLEKLTGPENTDDKLYAKCMEGLVRMWAGFPKAKIPSEKAYRLTLERLTAEPRTEARPPNSIMFDFTSTVSTRENDTFHQKWAAQATWFKLEELLAALEAVVKDRNSGWTARTGAIDAMAKLGAEKATFEALLEGYKDVEGQHGTDSHVLRRLQSTLEKM